MHDQVTAGLGDELEPGEQAAEADANARPLCSRKGCTKPVLHGSDYCAQDQAN